MQTTDQSTEGKDPQQTTGESSLDGAACSAWVRTADQLPCEVGEQADVLMMSDGWATWFKGMVTRWEDGTCEWAIYDQQNDRYYDWKYVPEFWMLIPSLPNVEVDAQIPAPTKSESIAD